MALKKYLSLKNYYNFALNQAVKLIAPALRLWESKKIKHYGDEPLQHQPIFIIGAPRTGSTILYQAITNLYDVLYIDNLVCRFHRNLFFGFWLSNMIYESKPHNNFQSWHGQTKGGHSPSECGQFWYRWLPKDHHFIDHHEITQQMIEEIRREVTAVINYFDKPLIFNNNNAGLRIRLISKIFPNAKWVICDREPLYVAQSLLKARQIKSGGIDKWWSMLPPNYKEILKKDICEQPVFQHYYINKQIFHDLLELTDKNNWLWMKYEDFSLNYEKYLNLIANHFFIANNRKGSLEPNINCNNNRYMEDSILKKIEICIERFDWNDYSS